MSRYSKKSPVSDQTKEEAMKVARATQRPAQTKEQTRLIAQGIQKGIDLYKKQQKVKARELDKKLKNATLTTTAQHMPEDDISTPDKIKSCTLPWILLLLSSTGFTVYLVLKELRL